MWLIMIGITFRNSLVSSFVFILEPVVPFMSVVLVGIKNSSIVVAV